MSKDKRCNDCGHFDCICGQPINVPTITYDGIKEEIDRLQSSLSTAVVLLKKYTPEKRHSYSVNFCQCYLCNMRNDFLTFLSNLEDKSK
jgi:hypothetical protein